MRSWKPFYAPKFRLFLRPVPVETDVTNTSSIIISIYQPYDPPKIAYVLEKHTPCDNSHPGCSCLNRNPFYSQSIWDAQTLSPEGPMTSHVHATQPLTDTCTYLNRTTRKGKGPRRGCGVSRRSDHQAPIPNANKKSDVWLLVCPPSHVQQGPRLYL